MFTTLFNSASTIIIVIIIRTYRAFYILIVAYSINYCIPKTFCT